MSLTTVHRNSINTPKYGNDCIIKIKYSEMKLKLYYKNESSEFQTVRFLLKLYISRPLLSILLNMYFFNKHLFFHHVRFLFLYSYILLHLLYQDKYCFSKDSLQIFLFNLFPKNNHLNYYFFYWIFYFISRYKILQKSKCSVLVSLRVKICSNFFRFFKSNFTCTYEST